MCPSRVPIFIDETDSLVDIGCVVFGFAVHVYGQSFLSVCLP